MISPPEQMPNAEPEERWKPVGASYNGEIILQSEQCLSQSEQLALLDWHPLFTGRCPECEMPIAQSNSSESMLGLCKLWLEGSFSVGEAIALSLLTA